MVDVLWWKSARWLATLAWSRATWARYFSLFLLPFCVREFACCARRSLFRARRRNLGALILVPSDRTANAVRPRSIPTSPSASQKRCASAAGSVWMTNEAKYRPAASLITVTLDGSHGKGRDQRTGTSPIFGSRSLPLGSTLNRAFAVNRIDWCRSFRDLNRGGPTWRGFGPFRPSDRHCFSAFR